MATPAGWLEAHGDCLYRYAMFRLRDPTAAEDVVRETLLTTQQSVPTSKDNSSERARLIGVLRTKILDHLRRIDRPREEPTIGIKITAYDPFKSSGEWIGHWREDMAPTQWQIDSISEQKRNELWESLDRCLSELPSDMSLAFTLREIDGLSSEEVCEALNISRSDLWLLLHRARMRLRNSLEAKWSHDEPPKIESASTGMAKQRSKFGIARLEKVLRAMQARFRTCVRFLELRRLIGWSE